jgi:hypothetical protein
LYSVTAVQLRGEDRTPRLSDLKINRNGEHTRDRPENPAEKSKKQCKIKRQKTAIEECRNGQYSIPGSGELLKTIKLKEEPAERSCKLVKPSKVPNGPNYLLETLSEKPDETARISISDY